MTPTLAAVFVVSLFSVYTLIRMWARRAFALHTFAEDAEAHVAEKDDTSHFEPRWVLFLRQTLTGGFVAAVMLYAVGVFRQFDWLMRWQQSGHLVLHIVGLSFGILGLLLLFWTHWTLGKHWTPALQLRTEHSLVTTGPYRWVRHPMYTSLIVFFSGVALLSGHPLVQTPAAVFVLFFVTRIPSEEAMLKRRFGEDYEAYAQRSSALVPFVW
ncbi:MAG: isoprenylcysteine carboxylmethyltransferase family protein [Deltaproteobacteria bacterium]|nr:MAG: isoprenylcysteine carboxylmethyltransferase family protein [Deltaproteobacteria bacterium]